MNVSNIKSEITLQAWKDKTSYQRLVSNESKNLKRFLPIFIMFIFIYMLNYFKIKNLSNLARYQFQLLFILRGVKPLKFPSANTFLL